ncbi:MAG: DUF72 domain-containing protein [Candidatus Parvarchaeota archaeon]|nr:DUF72 domain-containing protein [Candidatus Parvarchaeota archaeon]
MRGSGAFIGTSGWSYSWNEGKSLDWYASSSGLNAIEVNYSFYRFPSKSAVLDWSKEGKDLSWSIKVNRFITHVLKFNEKAERPMRDFVKTFEALEKRIDNYLFQLPPVIKQDKKERILEFLDDTGTRKKAVIEPRNLSWFDEEVFRYFKKNNVTLASIDSPLWRGIVKTSDKVYLRLHGRDSWYSYRYSNYELGEIAKKLKKSGAKTSFVFFNNDHAMLDNARSMRRLLSP